MINRPQQFTSPEEILKRRIIELEKENGNLRRMLLDKVVQERNIPTTPKEFNFQKKAPVKQTGISVTSKFKFENSIYSESDLCNDLSSLIESASEISNKRHRLAALESEISENDVMMSDLQQVIKSQSGEQSTIDLYKELKVVAKRLEENMKVREEVIFEEERLQESLEKIQDKIKLEFEKLSVSHFQFKSTNSPGKVVRSNWNPTKLKQAEVYENESEFDIRKELFMLKTELQRKEEQINELTKAMKYLAKGPQHQSSPGGSRLGLDNMLADISSIRYDPKLISLISDCMMTEKKVSTTKNVETIVGHLCQLFDPAVSPPKEELSKLQSDENKEESSLHFRTLSHSDIGKISDFKLVLPLRQSTSEKHLETQEADNRCQENAWSALDDSNINPLSLVDNNLC